MMHDAAPSTTTDINRVLFNIIPLGIVTLYPNAPEIASPRNLYDVWGRMSSGLSVYTLIAPSSEFQQIPVLPVLPAEMLVYGDAFEFTYQPVPVVDADIPTDAPETPNRVNILGLPLDAQGNTIPLSVPSVLTTGATPMAAGLVLLMSGIAVIVIGKKRR